MSHVVNLFIHSFWTPALVNVNSSPCTVRFGVSEMFCYSRVWLCLPWTSLNSSLPAVLCPRTLFVTHLILPTLSAYLCYMFSPWKCKLYKDPSLFILFTVYNLNCVKHNLCTKENKKYFWELKNYALSKKYSFIISFSGGMLFCICGCIFFPYFCLKYFTILSNAKLNIFVHKCYWLSLIISLGW